MSPASVESARPTWEEFSQHLASLAPVAVRLSGDPPLVLFVEPRGSRIGLRVDGRWDEQVATPYTSIEIGVVALRGGEQTEISTREEPLYRYFFGFALSVADAIQHEGLAPDAALRRAISQWRALFDQFALLTPDKQMGLLGELWLLNRLLDTYRDAALEAWTGPQGASHDFRIGEVEVEVKTTGTEHRIHMISSDSQLSPSPGHQLFLLSLQFTAGGTSGMALKEAIVRVRERLSSYGQAGRFDSLLEQAFGLSYENAQFYVNRMQLRSAPYLVPIGPDFPRITTADVLSLPHSNMTRISDVRYRLDVEGLGWEDGSKEFLAIIPGAEA